ncbi:unnamed protein product [Heterobilharzia americana]|nr:unnamed protein product [Heterobilharzia americana]
MTEQRYYLKKLQKSSNDQSFHFCECDLANSTNLINSLDQINWTHLTSLNLSSNKLRDITILAYTNQLEILNLSNNCLNNITSIINCKKLISLDCSKNEINAIPELNQLKFLEKLDISNNPLRSISGLWGCKSLRCLDLSSCQLTSSFIIGLDDDDIQLGAIDPFENANGLLTFSKNRNFCYNNTRPTFLGIPNLRILNLSYNPSIFHALSIQLTSNEWYIIQKTISDEMYTMNTDDNNKGTIFNVFVGNTNSNDTGGFGLLPNKIEYLNLQACDISLINGLLHMKRLHTLNLSYNQIMDVQALNPLRSLMYLQNLNLKHNPIGDQNDYFGTIICHLKQLKILNECQVTIMDKVRSVLYHEPSIEQTVKQDHRVNLLHQYKKPQKLRDCTLPNIDTPYPILAIIGPTGIKKRQLRQQLVMKLDNYFAPLLCHTTRPPRCKERRLVLNSKSINEDMLSSDQFSSNNNNNNMNNSPRQKLDKSSFFKHDNHHSEYDSIDYYFVSTEDFNRKQADGEFIQTAKIMGYQYGLSWETLESIARQGLAGIVVGELELLYGLQLAGLKPRCILCLPSKLSNHETRLRENLSQLDINQFEALCDNCILETSLQKSEQWITWCLERTTQLYPQTHHDNPGMFDAVLFEDSTQELFEQLLSLVFDYLDLNNISEYSHNLPEMFNNGEIQETGGIKQTCDAQ